jgi:hypothetical protein
MPPPVALADECLGRLFAALVSRRAPLDLAVTEWLLQGLLSAARQGVPLDEALGLAGGGARTLRRRLLTVRRDLHLADALAAVAVVDDVSEWQRCQRLAAQIRRFTSDVWPRAGKWAEPPSDWPAWKTALFRAAQTGIELPTSARAVSAACTRVAPYSRTRDARTILALYL